MTTIKLNQTMKTMNPMKSIKFLAIACFGAMALISCGDDDDGGPEEINEEEVITTLRLTLTSPGNTVTLLSRDADGDGPDLPVVTVSGNLIANTVYAGSIQFLNELESPAEDITLEVEEEDDEHQVFYLPTGGLNFMVTQQNNDGDGNPLGTTIAVSTGDASTGNLNVVLRHEPVKPNGGDLSVAGGETDIEVIFPVVVE